MRLPNQKSLILLVCFVTIITILGVQNYTETVSAKGLIINKLVGMNITSYDIAGKPVVHTVEREEIRSIDLIYENICATSFGETKCFCRITGCYQASVGGGAGTT